MTNQKTTYPRVIPVGETAFTVEYGNIVDATLNAKVHALDIYLQAYPLEGITETVPSYRSLLVMYDPARVNTFELQKVLLKAAKENAGEITNLRNVPENHIIEIPVRYGDEWGPDIADVASHNNLSIETVIHTHTEPTYQVAMLGFAPGFTYLLGLPPELHTPRLPTPRVHVPPGSVGIAGSQTGLYALDTPGGWRIIGRTTLTLFDPESDPPFLLSAGDRIRFTADG